MNRLIRICVLSLFLFLMVAAYATAQGQFQSTMYTDRMGGADRIETAIEISKFIIPDGTDVWSFHVFICRNDDYPDALAIASLAGYYESPILLNPTDELDDRVEDELERLSEYGDLDVTVVGETGAISDDVMDEIEDLNFVDEVDRIGGKDRYETAKKIAEECEDQFQAGECIFVCTGENWPDALAIAGLSYNCSADIGCHYPILLVKKNEIPDSTLDWLLANRDRNAYVIGGTGAISSDVMEDLGYYMDGDVKRVHGDNRYETCVAIAEDEDLWGWDRDGEHGNTFTFATGLLFPDSLTGSSIAGMGNQREPAPVLLTSSIDEAVEDYLSDIFDGVGNGFGYVLGQTGAISKDTEDDIAELLSDGDFEPTDDEPEIQSFDVTINPDNDIPDVAQYDFNDEVEFDVETDEHIWNEDGLLGKVVIEDISELGGKEAPYNEDDFELGWDYGDDASDNGFSDSILVKKKSTDPDQREVTFVAKATNQAGSDTMESDEVEIYN